MPLAALSRQHQRHPRSGLWTPALCLLLLLMLLLLLFLLLRLQLQVRQRSTPPGVNS